MRDELVDRKTAVLIFVSMGFIAALMLAVVASVKVHELSLFGWGLLLPAGTLAFAFTYLFTDVISEIWGRAYAIYCVLVGVAIRLAMVAYFWFSVDGESAFALLSVAPFWTIEQQESFSFVLTGSSKVIMAGIVSFAVSSLLDVQIYHYFKDKHYGKNLLFLRNNISTMLSQLVNSIIFIGIVFGGVVSMNQLFLLIAGQVVVKMFVAFVDTPLVYAIVNYAHGRPVWTIRNETISDLDG